MDIFDHFDEDGKPVMRADVLAVYVDIYFNEDVNYDREAFGTLMIYVYGTEINRPITVDAMSDKDTQTLEAFGKK